MIKSGETILSTQNIGKNFSDVWVLKDINFDLKAGEILALAGENGAGKSTFIKILSGLYSPDSGSINLAGKNVKFDDVSMSEESGIRTVHQEINLIPFFKVYQNIFIGDEITKRIAGIGLTDDKRMKEKTREVLSLLASDISSDTYIHNLDASHQRIIQIAKVLAQKPSIMIFDEPTTSLGEKERQKLLDIIVSLKQYGIGIIYISHNLDEIMKIADRVTVFRDGRFIDTKLISECTPESIISMMIGNKSYELYHRLKKPNLQYNLLQVKDVFNHRLKNINLTLHRGEILGIAGVVGAGKSELAQVLFGIDRTSKGMFYHNSNEFKPGVDYSINNGIALVPEERQKQGLIPNFSVERNISIAYLDQFRKSIEVDTKRERLVAETYIKALSIRTEGPLQQIQYLSGGNQQKVVLSRWLHGDFQVGLFDEPTKGIDVKAKEDIYLLLGSLADQGKGIIFFSSYLPELLNVCDRIIVLSNGCCNGEFNPKDEGAETKIVHAMLTGGIYYDN